MSGDLIFPGTGGGAEGRAGAQDGTPGCTVIWRHVVTGASLGICGGQAEHEVTAHCPSCRVTGNQRACGYCWGSYAATGLCGACLGPLEITERTRAA